VKPLKLTLKLTQTLAMKPTLQLTGNRDLRVCSPTAGDTAPDAAAAADRPPDAHHGMMDEPAPRPAPRPGPSLAWCIFGTIITAAGVGKTLTLREGWLLTVG
jgi:hypothetical protein